MIGNKLYKPLLNSTVNAHRLCKDHLVLWSMLCGLFLLLLWWLYQISFDYFQDLDIPKKKKYIWNTLIQVRLMFFLFVINYWENTLIITLCLWLVKNVILHLYIYVRYGWYILNVWKYCCVHDCVVNWSRFSLTNYALEPVHVFTLLCKTSLIRVSFSVVYHVILCVGP